MSLLNNIPETESQTEKTLQQDVISIDASKIENSVLQRLLEEVKCESQNNVTAYNRLHNRHNRSR